MSANIKQGFGAYLAGLAAVADLVADRVYPEAVPESAVYPRVVLSLSQGERLQQLGTSGGNGWATFSVECWAATYADADALARAITGVDGAHPLDDYQGLMGTVRVQSVDVTDTTDSVIPPVHGEGAPTYTVTLTVRIFYEE